MTYRDFEIEIASREPDSFEVEVYFDGADDTIERRFVVQLPPSYVDLIPPDDGRGVDELRNWRRAPEAGRPDELPFLIARMDKLRDYGDRLFRTVLPPQLEQALGHLLAMGGTEGGVRIRLDLERAPALAKVPWEALFRRATDEWYGISERSPMLRRIGVGGKAAAPEPIIGEVRLLVAIAVPQKDLDAGREIASIEDEIRKRTAGKATRIAIQPLHAATRRSFESALADFDPHIVHFIGHGGFGERDGGRRGVVHFVSEDDPEGYDAVPSDDMRDLLANNRPMLVVLNTCEGGRADEVDRYGGTAQNIVRRSIPYVVAMQYPVSDEAALAFSRYFYERLLEGAPVDVAVARGRAAIRNRAREECQVELITPVLYSAVDTPGPLVDTRSPTEPAPMTPPPAILASGAASAPTPMRRDGHTSRRRALAIAAAVLGLLLASGAIAWLTLSGERGGARDGTAGSSAAPTDGTTTPAVGGSPYAIDAEKVDLVPPTAAGSRPILPTRSGLPRGHVAGPSTSGERLPPASPGRRPAGAVDDDTVVRPTGASRADDVSPVDEGEFRAGPDPLVPPPPPADLPPPPPPPAALPRFDGPVIAFFDFDSRAISPEAAMVLDHAAALYGASYTRRLVVAGFADRRGSEAVNMRVSRARARAAAAYLTAQGVPEDAITIEAHGESRPRVETADGVEEVQNRRVEITAVEED